MLHKEGMCTRMEKEPLDVISKVWTEFRVQVKTIVMIAREEIDKEKEDSLLLAGLKKLVIEEIQEILVKWLSH